MGQCLGCLWPNRYKTSSNKRAKEYLDGADFNTEDEVIYTGRESTHHQKQTSTPGCLPKETLTQSLSGMFPFTKRNNKHSAYLLENTDDDSHIEMYDMVTDPRYFRCAPPPPSVIAHQDTNGSGTSYNRTRENHETSRGGNSSRQPDLRQVVGLRNTLTCCVMQRSQYGKLKNEYSNDDGGAAYIVLNPRNLNTALSASDQRSKWSINSVASESERYHPPSIDLEWETEDALVEAAASHDALNKNDEPGIKTSCDPDTCSISTTTVACTKGSRASSQISLPGLDWDSQVDNDDLVSLNNVETTDFETEQLISEIELLTSRALQETQQWGSSQHQSSSPAKPSKTTVLVEANNNPTTTESTSWTLAN